MNTQRKTRATNRWHQDTSNVWCPNYQGSFLTELWLLNGGFFEKNRFSLITSSVYMIFTKFFFEKTYFVKMHLLMYHLSTYGHCWLSYDQLTVSSVEVGDFGLLFLNNFVSIHDVHQILFEKTYFVKTHLLMAYLSTYDEYWLSYDQITVSSVGFRRFWPFFLNNFVSIQDNPKTLFWEGVFCQDASADGSFIYLRWILTELWPNNCLVRWISAILTVFSS
jgi:hypothetical protein